MPKIKLIYIAYLVFTWLALIVNTKSTFSQVIPTTNNSNPLLVNLKAEIYESNFDGVSFTIKVRVTNSSLTDCNKPFGVLVDYHNSPSNSPLYTTIQKELPAGKSIIFTIKFIKPTINQLYLIADFNKVIKESSESDNVDAYTITTNNTLIKNATLSKNILDLLSK